MKTKSWTKPIAAPSEPDGAHSFDMLAPAYLGLDGSDLQGPFPLYLAMHKALDVSRFSREVELQAESGELLLQLKDSRVLGNALFISLFVQLRASARTFYSDLTEAVRRELGAELGLSESEGSEAEG